MGKRTLVLQDQIRSTTSGIEYDDTLDITLGETVVNEETITDPLGVSGTLIMDMNFLRTAVRDIKGSPSTISWTDQVVDNPTFTTLSGARGALNTIQSFIEVG